MKKFVPRNHTKVYPSNSYTIEQGRKEMAELRQQVGNRKDAKNGVKRTCNGLKHFG